MLNRNELKQFYKRNMNRMSEKEINNTIVELKSTVRMLENEKYKKQKKVS